MIWSPRKRASKKLSSAGSCAPGRQSPAGFYDERGSALFETMCSLPEYYPSRTEIAILDEDGR